MKPPLKEAFDAEQEQKRLRDAHGIDDDTVTVNEKSSAAQTLKQLRKIIGGALRITGYTVLVGFAIIGFLVLIYPDIRIEIKFFTDIGEVLNKIIEFIGG